MKRLKDLIGVVVAIVSTLAVLDQIGRAPVDQNWHGRVIGVPYDFRPPSISRLRERIWNQSDERILVPHVWGVGWTVNLYQLRRRLQLLIA